MLETRCILTVHAHPDDESSKGAGTIARYASDGVRTVLVCCTDGAEGDIVNPELDRADVRADLGAFRRAELERAAAIIGYHHIEMLGYRDSGMAGAEANANPDCFHMAALEEATERLVSIIRRERPQVIITYPDVQDQYPHPDHLKAHEVAFAAFLAAGDPDVYPDAGEPYQPAKLYYTLWPAQRIKELHAAFVERGLESPYDQEWLARIDENVDTTTTKIDLVGFNDVRAHALRAHGTQIDPTSVFWFGLPDDVAATIYPYDHYRLAISHVGPIHNNEIDLFESVV